MQRQIDFHNKIYLIGGVPRSGKSLLSQRLYKDNGIQYISTDTIRFMLQKKYTLEEFSIKPKDNETKEEARTEYMWIYLKSFILTQKRFTETGYCIEGVHLTPTNLAQFKNQKDISMIFLGYADADPNEKLDYIRKHMSPHDWLADRSDKYVLSVIEHLIEVSKKFRDDCERLGLKYIETSDRFEDALNDAYDYLV